MTAGSRAALNVLVALTTVTSLLVTMAAAACTDPNCVSCSPYASVCTTCGAKYGVTTSYTCVACTNAGCTSACNAGAGLCDSTCSSNYWYDTTKHVCVACDPHCTSGCNTQHGGKCDSACAAGYFLSSYTCVRYPVECDAHCTSSCTSANTCSSSCAAGYSLKSSRCVLCDTHCSTSGCRTNGAGKCDSACIANWALYNAGHTCVQCDVNCASTTGCTTNGAGTCDSACKTGYALYPTTHTCVTCDPNCATTTGCTVKGAGKCDSACKTGFGLTATFTCVGFNLAMLNISGKVTFYTLDTNGHEVIGLAPVDDKLYVVCTLNGVGTDENVYVFENSAPYELITTFTVPGMEAGDMVADLDRKALYIIGFLGNDEVIWKVDLLTRNQTVVLPNAAHWVGTLSLASNHRVLGAAGNGKLNLLNVDLGTVESLTLPESIKDPQHAVQAPDGVTFYVGQGYQPDEPNKVSALNLTSDLAAAGLEVIDQFGLNQTGDGTTGLNSPNYLALFNGMLYVVDMNNRRVISLNPVNLTLHEVALDHSVQPEVGWPHRLAVTDNGKTLLVGMALSAESFY